MSETASPVQVRGAASPEELAALLAVVAMGPTTQPDGYTRWRAGRLNALRRRASSDE